MLNVTQFPPQGNGKQECQLLGLPQKPATLAFANTEPRVPEREAVVEKAEDLTRKAGSSCPESLPALPPRPGVATKSAEHLPS